MTKEVYKFNQVKNGFKYDEELEIKMYQEEVAEFFNATTTAERMDALVDCNYVRLGTMMKLSRNGKSYINDMPYTNEEPIMVSILQEEIGEEMFYKVIRLAEDIVCKANECKPNVLVDGKVSKDKDTPDATAQIEVMIEEQQRLQAAIEDAHAKRHEESTKNP